MYSVSGACGQTITETTVAHATQKKSTLKFYSKQ